MILPLSRTIDEDLWVYRKIFELNKEDAMRDQFIKEGKKDEEFRDKLLLDVDLLAYCWFKEGVKMVRLREGSMFKEGGRNDLDKI